MIRIKRLSVASALLVASALAAAPLSFAAQTATEAIQARQKAMKGIDGAMESLVAIAKKQAPFDAAVVKKAGETIASHLTEAQGLFPAGSEKGDVQTWAKPTIWSDGAGFAAALKSSHEAATALAGVKEEAAFLPALKALGGSCKHCHETYRLPKR